MKVPQSNIYRLMKTKAGSPPGTLIHTFAQSTAETSVRLISFKDDFYENTGITNLEELPSLLKPDCTNWIQFTGLSDVEKLDQIGQLLQINPLIIEDILNTEHLPKSEEIDGQLFFVIKMLGRNSQTDEFEVNHVCFVLGENFLISFMQRSSELFDPFITRIEQSVGKIRQRTNDYILYRLIDIIVDNYYLLFTTTEEKLQEVEETLMKDQSADMTGKIQAQKKELNFMRRYIFPVAEAIRLLLKSDSLLIKKHHRSFFNDTNDHLIYLSNAAEHYRDMIAGLMELQMMNNSNRMNNVMKSLTLIATIFIPLTFLAGVYGMNFKHMPELDLAWTYPAVLALMFTVGVGMYIYMRRKNWF
ncbi:MAG: magnesium/cobalt transporter CorA [Bacteroidales bacterium]|nr:magnesium/cobalt transporter CorA [Bacteroidales bacterium]